MTVAVLAVCSAQAVLYTYTWDSGFANGGVIPDGNVAGWTDTREITDITGADTILDVNVRLEIDGGYNGDLYGYLVHSSGFAVLLNRIGRDDGNPFGSSGAGMDITLDDSAGTDIHLAGSGILSGTYQPDGRSDDPATVTDDDTNRDALLSSFNSLGANGTWTLFLADMAGGDVSTVLSWGLDIEVVPEPTTWALIVFGTVASGVGAGRWVRRRKQV